MFRYMGDGSRHNIHNIRLVNYSFKFTWSGYFIFYTNINGNENIRKRFNNIKTNEHNICLAGKLSFVGFSPVDDMFFVSKFKIHKII